MKNKNLKLSDILLLALLPLISIFVSNYQAQYSYDGFHWGLIIFNAKKFIDGGVLYKDIFVHYGFLTTLINSVLLEISNQNILFVFFFYSLFYSLGLLLIGIIIFKINKNLYLALFSIFVFFLLHPFAIYPWHSYLIFFLLTLYIFALNFENIKYQNLILIVCCCISESFIYPAIFIIIFDILFEPIFLRKKISFEKIKNNLIIFLFFFIFISIFFYTNNKFIYWLKYIELPKIFLNEIHQRNIFEMIFNLFNTIFVFSYSRFFSESHWFIYLIIILFNSLLIIWCLISKRKINSILIYVSFICIVLLSTVIHNISIFKLATSLSLGLIVIISLIYQIENIYSRMIFLSLLFFISLISFKFKKNNSNPLFVKDFQNKEYVYSDDFNNFRSQKWSPDTWKHLGFLKRNSKTLKKNCKIKYSYNLTKDAFYSILLSNYFKVDQIIPWFQFKERHFMNSYYYSINNHFDKNLFTRIEKKLKSENSIIIAYKENYQKIYWGNKKLDFSEKMNFIELPNHDYIKDIILIYPKSCLI